MLLTTHCVLFMSLTTNSVLFIIFCRLLQGDTDAKILIRRSHTYRRVSELTSSNPHSNFLTACNVVPKTTEITNVNIVVKQL